MYKIDRSGQVVGYSLWPWEPIYSGLVGCLQRGRLVAFAECSSLPQPDFAGPPQRCWFRMDVDDDVRSGLEIQNPAYKIVRLEDGRPLEAAFELEAAPRRLRVEDFLSRTPSSQVRLDGFTAFLSSPAGHQVEILFLDFLGRPPDEEAKQGYQRAVLRGMSVFDVRAELLRSEEFQRRRITATDRVGALVTSPLWNTLRKSQPLNELRRTLRTVDLATYRLMSDDEFAHRVHLDCHGDDPSAGSRAELVKNVQTNGRFYVASLLARDASHGGNFVELLDE